MSRRGLVVALLCGLLGLVAGAVVAYVERPSAVDAGAATPVAAESPSVPIDVPTVQPYARDLDYDPLLPGLSLPVTHRVRNKLATWQYHVPQGWTAYSACIPGVPCRTPDNTVIPPKRVDRNQQVRFRPAGEPLVGGYSLRVRILDNTLAMNTGQLVSTKVRGFQDAFTDFTIIRQTPSAVYFTYRDGGNHLRYNFFQWFAAPGSTTATLEMSVSGRQSDAKGLQALFNRFADDVQAL
ncbi:MAG: hypothetical protein ACR2K3_05360 [Nocardioides sp.]